MREREKENGNNNNNSTNKNQFIHSPSCRRCLFEFPKCGTLQLLQFVGEVFFICVFDRSTIGNLSQMQPKYENRFHSLELVVVVAIQSALNRDVCNVRSNCGACHNEKIYRRHTKNIKEPNEMVRINTTENLQCIQFSSSNSKL